MIRNEKGIALVTALMFTLISLGIVMMLLYTVTQGIRTSAAAKRYQNAREASFGAMDIISKEIIPHMFAGYSTSKLITDYSTGLIGDYSTSYTNLALSSGGGCLRSKLFSATNNWAACGANSTTAQADVNPDLSFKLRATTDPAGYTVYSKIVDTKCGGNTLVGQPCSNSDPSAVDYLDVGGGVTSSTGTVTPQHLPAYYRIEIQGQRSVNPSERSRLSVLYAY